jgi:hypothetical protein
MDRDSYIRKTVIQKTFRGWVSFEYYSEAVKKNGNHL